MISRCFSLVLTLSLLFTSALAAQTIDFIDDGGDPTSEVLQGDLARIRLTSPVDNTGPGYVDLVSVQVTSLYGGDYRYADLVETGADTGVFEGSIQLESPWETGLVTADSGFPDFFSDQVTASYSSAMATATVRPAIVHLLDDLGQVAASYAVGETVYIRVTDLAREEPGQVDQASVDVEALGSGDLEFVQLTETGTDTGVFEGSITAAPGSTSSDGQIDTSIGETVRVTYYSPLAPNQETAEAAIGGPQIYFLDADGQPTSTYLAGGTVYLRVIDALAGTGPGMVDTVHAVIASLLTGDLESVLLTETGAATGYYEGSIQLSVDFGSSQDGVLQTSEFGGPPHQFDTLTASFENEGIGFTEETAMTTDPVVTFVDANGNEANAYSVDSTLYVQVEDPTQNYDPSGIDYTYLEILSTGGDEEYVDAIETGVDTGVFAAVLPLGSGAVTIYDNIAQADLGETVEARYFGYFGYTTPNDQALVQDPLTVTFVDFLGQPITVSAQETDVHPWVEDNNRNDPTMVDSFSVVLSSPTSDTETLTLTETGIDTGIFTGSIMVSEFGSYLPEDGVLDALNSHTISFTYNHYLDPGTTSSAELTLMENYAPYAIDDSATAPIDGSVDIAVLANDFDTEPGALTVLAASQGADGSTAVNGDQTVTYTPNPGFSGTDTFTYIIADFEGGQARATVTVTLNSAPAVLITFPADGAVLEAWPEEGYYFTATATDPEDGDLSAGIDWASDLDGFLGAGSSVSLISLSLGVHTITASVNDGQGTSGSTSITVTVNEAPNVVITMPFDGLVATDADPITFAATATDAEDGDLAASLTWTSDVDGALATGASFTTATLSVGLHVITASVSDSLGTTTSASISIRVETNPLPTVTVTTPTDGSVHTAGTSVTFVGTAFDPGEEGDGDLTASLAWTSDIDGAIGTGGSLTTSTLTVGAHTITASVTDSQGGSGSASISIMINAPPSVSITAPANGSSSTENDSVTFTGTASDAEDGDLTASLSWTSSIDGAIGTGGSLTTLALSVGTHTITATVNDSNGAADSSTITVTVNANQAPSVAITSPADATTIDQGASVSFVGTASDNEDGDLTASLSWTSSVDGAIGTGASFSIASLSAGAHTITASVADSHGAAGSATITVTINVAPTVAITAPADGSSSTETDPVTFTGTASDAEDGDLTPSLSWTSSIDGSIGTGGSLTTLALSVGTHTITATVNDSNGAADSSTITVTVNANQAPTVAITSPADATTVDQGASVSFASTASDNEDGDLTASLSWTSSVDGAIGTGASFSTASLSAGAHTITASVTDSHGTSGSSSITVTINVAPTVTITAPSDGMIVATGDTVTFTGSALDAEDGDLGAALTWTSPIDGAIGVGGTFDTTTLSAGTHLITAAVIDSAGAAAADTVTVVVKVPIQITLNSIAGHDGYTRESNENSGVGNRAWSTGGAGSRDLRIGDNKKDRQFKGFVSFDTSTIPAGAILQSATLRLRRDKTNGTNPHTTHGLLKADIVTGFFGAEATLVPSDFEATATATGVATLSDAPSDDDWSVGDLDTAGINAMNLVGTTQLRLYFELDDNDDQGQDYIEYFSSDNSSSVNHPQLVIEYLD